MGGLSERLAALEEAAASRALPGKPEPTPEEATAWYRKWKSAPPDVDAPRYFDGLTAGQAIARYLELIGAGAGRVPKGRG